MPIGVPPPRRVTPEVHNRWRHAEDFCRERLKSDPGFDVASYFYDCRLGWLELIKSLRALRDVGMCDAQREALENPRWHAWVLFRIRTEPACAKEARAHIRLHGDASLIKL